eukprot:SAG11_NODE_7178_length_1183_cov_0.668819_2_plen_86_part_00
MAQKMNGHSGSSGRTFWCATAWLAVLCSLALFDPCSSAKGQGGELRKLEHRIVKALAAGEEQVRVRWELKPAPGAAHAQPAVTVA